MINQARVRKGADTKRKTPTSSVITRGSSGPESAAPGALEQRVGNQGMQRLIQNMSGGSHEAPSVGAGLQSSGGSGTALPATTRAFFEPRFGADFGDVRVHTGPQAQGA